MIPFHGCGSTASRLEPLQRGSLLFTTKCPAIPGNHFINLIRMKALVALGASFEHGTPGLGIQIGINIFYGTQGSMSFINVCGTLKKIVQVDPISKPQLQNKFKKSPNLCLKLCSHN